MNKVKTNLLALAAGVLISPVVMAGDINSATWKKAFANEALGLAGVGDVLEGGQLAVILNAEFTQNDVITLTFSGAALDASTVPTTVVADGTACPGIAPAQCATLTFGLLNADSGSAQFRVTEINNSTGTTTVGLPVIFGPADVLEFDPAAVLAAAGVTVTYAAQTNTGLPLDTGAGPVIPECEGIDCNARSTAYIQTGQYFGIDNTPDEFGNPPLFDDTVDVNTQRTTLVDANVGLGGDEGGFAATLNRFPGANEAVVVSFDGHNPTFTGDFAWVNDPATAVADGVVSVFGDCGEIVVTATAISAECGEGFATLRLDPAAQAPLATLSAGAFDASTDVLYSDQYFCLPECGPAEANDVLETGSFSVGEWDLNGFQADLSYTPYGGTIAQIIYLANRGPQAGDVTVDYVDQNGVEGSLGVIGTLQPTSTLSIGPAIKAALPAALRNFGRLALTITVNAPACDVQVNAQYDAGGGRRAYTSSRDNCEQSGGSY